ncbi:MAG: T9SS type A sorting domain-containing protein [Bacteroidia bacterium]|nr:T9SS type A sorting domain-containing protein [Bacteroidia bacterium]NNJ55567.1 T9SS type A sorting domain-containing protein [Bacteroidia bacterium]
MKRFLSSTAIVFAGLIGLAQNCNPNNSITVPGIYPGSIDTAMVNVPYNFTMQVLAVGDTMVNYLGQQITATIDSVVLTGISGLPSSFSYGCEPVGCVFTSQNVGCVKLSGTPTAQEIGVHPLTIYTTAYAKWNTLKLPVLDSISDYNLVVSDSGSASIFKYTKDEISVYPNPSLNGKFTIQTRVDVSNIAITDIQGKEVNFEYSKISTGIEIEMKDVSNGIYFIRFNAGGKTIEKRIIQ